jgi:hypothetical protein
MLELIRQAPYLSNILVNVVKDIVHAISNNGMTCDVGSTYPGAGEGPKGLAVRQLKSYASWVQTVVRQVGPLSAAGVDS